MIYASLHYSVSIHSLTDEQWAVFSRTWPSVRADTKRESCYVGERQRLTLEEAHTLEQCGIRLEYEGVDGTMLTKMRDRTKWTNHGDGEQHFYDRDIRASDVLSGAAVQIAIPDLGLLQIDEVTHLDDECTDVLQDHLRDGWRILAVCPPNAQRRPDYILGRKKRPE